MLRELPYHAHTSRAWSVMNCQTLSFLVQICFCRNQILLDVSLLSITGRLILIHWLRNQHMHIFNYLNV